MSSNRYSALQKKDLVAILETADSMFACESSDELIEASFRGIRKLVSCSQSSFLRFSPTTLSVYGIYDDPGLTEEFIQNHAEQYIELAPTHPGFRPNATGTDGLENIACTSDILPNSEYRNQPIYCDVLRHYDGDYQALLSVGMNPAGDFVGYSADRSAKDFTKRDKQALSALCTQIREAHAKIDAFENLLRSNQAQVENGNVIPKGGMMVDATGKILHGDEQTRRFLHKHFADYRDDTKYLPTNVNDWLLAIHEKYQAAVLPPIPKFYQACQSGYVEIIITRAKAVGEYVLQVSLAIVGSSEELGKHYGLTSRELEVLEQLMHGLTNKQIAQRLGIKEATIKTHLLHIFDKLKVSSRTAAARLAFSLLRQSV